VWITKGFTTGSGQRHLMYIGKYNVHYTEIMYIIMPSALFGIMYIILGNVHYLK
jgi:hypothetical protein